MEGTAPSHDVCENEGKAMLLLALDADTNKLILNDEAVDFLKSIECPIAVISAAESQYTSKSELLYQMMFDQESSEGKYNKTAGIPGLWIWNSTIDETTADGKSMKVVAIDSIGVEALEKEAAFDPRIGALAVLISSSFLYTCMGSDYQSEIANLTAMTDLAKKIWRLNTKKDKESSFEESALPFPSFYWILHNNKEASTSKAFEEALNEFVNETEKKNVLFSEKESVVLAKPVLNDEDSENISNEQSLQLATEWKGHVSALRGRILGKIRAKESNGATLDGSMLLELIRSYVKLINENSHQDVSNSLLSSPQSQVQNAVEEAAAHYEALIKESLQERLPLSLSELKAVHVAIKKIVIHQFKQSITVGTAEAETLENELLRKIKLLFQNIKEENEQELMAACNVFILNQFGNISKKLKNDEFRSFFDFDKELKNFDYYFTESGPQGPNRRVIILEFLQEALSEGAGYFVRKLHQDLELQQSFFHDIKSGLERQIEQAKLEASSENSQLKVRLGELEREKADLQFREEHLQKEIKRVHIEKSRFEDQLREENARQKGQLQLEVDSLKEKVSLAMESTREAERKNFLLQSNFEKEFALMEQKIQYYEKSIEELSNKEKELLNELKEREKNSLAQIKEAASQYDNVNKTLQNRVKQLEDRVSELEAELTTKEQELQREKLKSESLSFESSPSFEEAQNTIKMLHLELSNAKKQGLRIEAELKKQHESSLNELSDRVSQLEEQLHSKDESYKLLKGSTDKEKALLKQKIEFLELQLQESQSQVNDIKRAYDATLSLFDTQTTLPGVNERQLNELREKHKAELTRVENEFETMRKRLVSEIEQLTERNHELELKSKLDGSDYGSQLKSLKEELADKGKLCENLTAQIAQLEKEKQDVAKEIEERYTGTIKGLEDQMEQLNQQAHKELLELQQQTETNLMQLRAMYDDERGHYERKLLEEREKWEQKHSALAEEYEMRLREEAQAKEEENEALRDEIRELEARLLNEEQQHEQESSLKEQTIQTLQKYLQETRETLQRFQNSNTATLEQTLKSFSEERGSMMAKIENLTLEIAKRDREIFALTQAKEQADINIVKREMALEREKTQLIEEKAALANKLDELKTKSQKIHDEALEKQVEYSREIALSKQQNEFLTKKIEELQKQFEDLNSRHEDKISAQRQLLEMEFCEKNQKILQEKAELEEKSEKMAKLLKDMETKYNSQLSQLEKEKINFKEKIAALDRSRSESEKSLFEDYEELQAQMAQCKGQFAQERKNLMAEVEKYKALYTELDQEHAEIVANYERDKALWKGKFSFLEQQKEQAKNDLQDAQKKFELTLMQFQKHMNNDKAETESSHNALIMSLEQRYQNHIVELTEAHEQKVYELESMIKNLEKTIRISNDKKLIENNSQGFHQSYYEKRIKDLVENEKRLVNEIERLKQSKEGKVSEYQKLLEREREAWKEKAAEIERKLKESELRRNSLIFEHEKDKARWSLEKDHLLSQKSETNELVARLERKVESLMRGYEPKPRRSSKGANIPTPLWNLTNGNKIRSFSPMNTDSTRSNNSVPEKLRDLTNFGGTRPSQFEKRSGSISREMNCSVNDVEDDC